MTWAIALLRDFCLSIKYLGRSVEIIQQNGLTFSK